MGLPVCCNKIMRVGITNHDNNTQIIFCIKCGRSITVDTTKEEEAK